MTLFRFVFAFVKEKASKKLKILIIGQISLSITAIFLVKVLNMHSLATYCSSMVLGITLSASYGLFLVLPMEFGM
jgi:hypothetical protein